MSQVSFDGGTFPLDDVQESPARYVKRLERAKVTPGYAVCLCATHVAPLQLVIRRYGSLLHLAGWPDDGHRHADGAPFIKTQALRSPPVAETARRRSRSARNRSVRSVLHGKSRS
jgi:hypothetical protein